jgi:LEA14-like dessication related protein
MSSRRSLAVLFLPALLVAILAACANRWQNFKEPVVSLDHVVMRGVGITGGNLDLVLDVYNPNSFSLKGTRLQMGFEVEDKRVGEIEYKEEFQIQEGDTTRLTLPLSFNWAGAGAALRQAINYGDIPYTLKGQATVRTPFGQQVVPFTKKGRAKVTNLRLGGR